MNQQPLVSIIIPTYNDTEYLKEAINSALAQTYKNIEIIVINDGSTNIKDIKYLEKFPYLFDTVKLINKKNEGLSLARNTGIKESKGEFIIPLDADDMISTDFVEKTLRVISKDSNIGVVYTNQRFFGDENKIMEMLDFDFEKLLSINHVSVCSLIRRTAYDVVKNNNGVGYNPNMKFGYEDWDFWISIAECGYKFECIHQPLFWYRKRTNSMSTLTVTKHDFLIERLIQNHTASFNKYHIQIIKDLQNKVKDSELLLKSINTDLNNNSWIVKRFIKNIPNK